MGQRPSLVVSAQARRLGGRQFKYQRRLWNFEEFFQFKFQNFADTQEL